MAKAGDLMFFMVQCKKTNLASVLEELKTKRFIFGEGCVREHEDEDLAIIVGDRADEAGNIIRVADEEWISSLKSISGVLRVDAVVLSEKGAKFFSQQEG